MGARSGAAILGAGSAVSRTRGAHDIAAIIRNAPTSALAAAAKGRA